MAAWCGPFHGGQAQSSHVTHCAFSPDSNTLELLWPHPNLDTVGGGCRWRRLCYGLLPGVTQEILFFHVFIRDSLKNH